MATPDLIRLDIVVDEEQYDTVAGLLVRNISYGWEEDSLPTGETRFRVHCDNAIVQETPQRAAAWLPGLTPTDQHPASGWTVAWREFFTPVRAGQFIVLPPWLFESTPLEGRKPIIIEPKSAFGTGHHNTTVLCLEAITELLASGRLKAGQRFFDVGTGSGILGIACCLNGLAGLGSDIDPVAVDNALENVVINKVADDFRIVPGSAEAGEGEQFDLVVANILAGPLRELAPALIARMKPGACLVLSGLLDVQADAVEAAYAELGKARRVQSGDWVALVWGE
ncbi:MAG: 50S ribosomal protein L11 methyltransferase [Bilophila wadsworthia]